MILSILLFLILLLGTSIHSKFDFMNFAVNFAYSLFVSFLFFRSMKTKKISQCRSVLFILLSVFFILCFKIIFTSFFTPYCHIAMSSNLIRFIYNAFSDWKVQLGILWLIVTLGIGQAWCSWICFFGGIDEFFSKLLPRPILKVRRLPTFWANFSLGLLLFLFLVSFIDDKSTFCIWFCPLKMTTAFCDSTNMTARTIQIVLLFSLGTSLLVFLPLMTKKRTFCGVFCPFGAWQSLAGRISPFHVKIESQKCGKCDICMDICSLFAIGEKDNEYTILSNCTKCGMCIDQCPDNAITINHPKYFLFSCYLISGAMGASFIPKFIVNCIEKLFL